MIRRVNFSMNYVAIDRYRGQPWSVEIVRVVISDPRAVRKQVRQDLMHRIAGNTARLPLWRLKKELEPGDVIVEHAENPDGWMIVNRRDLFYRETVALILADYTEE